MDTKWNGMDNNPGEELEYFVADRVKAALGEAKEKRPGGVKAGIGFLAFFLGVTLVLQSLMAVGAQIVWERDLTPPFFTGGWQETESFRAEVAGSLRDFLTLGAGGKLDIYDREYWEFYDGLAYDSVIMRELEDTCLAQEQTRAGVAEVQRSPYFLWKNFDTGSAVSESGGAYLVELEPGGGQTVQPESEREIPKDANYQYDKNVVYYIKGGTGEDQREYTNAPGGDKSLFKLRTNSEYNFYLIFENGEARIYKDGVELDVYGGGFYNEESQWFVPGYENFPANEQLDGVTVYMAVRANPVRYFSVDYETGSQYSNNRMYWIAQKVEQANQFYRTQAALCGSGVLLLCVWFLLRRHKRLADAKIASWTVHVWTEARFVLGLLLVVCLICGRGLPEFYYGMRELCWAMDDGYYFSVIGLGMSFLRLLLGNIPVLLMLVWFFWLIYNDHRHNPKEARRSLLRPFLRALRAKDLKRPVEKRISRMGSLCSLAVAMLELELIFFLVICSVNYYYSPLPPWSLWTLFLLPLLVAAGIVVRSVLRQEAVARDLGLLADQVEAVRAGDLFTPLKLPEDADLQKTAESLNDIQAGMKAALEEQTRSERMKVELVSNVSHDLKTPLTSILSYAELLRQEDLPPAAADYARIIDEKAQRLKGMVQDVFEVSKAAADQLPVQMERLDLAKLLRQTLADLDGPIQRSALTFKIDLPEEPVMITADGKRLYRIFQNLIDNALRYALEGSRVYLTLNTSEEQADVSVRNTSRTELPEGVDFTARFVRGDASRTDGGSGLGLSIVKSFVEACGGCFRVETVADLFTAVVTFPLSM